MDCTADKVEMLPKLLSHFDEPFADPVIVPTYQVAELASQHVKVVLTGEGADELFLINTVSSLYGISWIEEFVKNIKSILFQKY